MSNSVTIRTTVPGAKQATAEVAGLKGAFTGLTGSSGPLGSFTKGMLGGAAAGIAAGAAFGTLTDTLKGVGEFLGNAAQAAIDDDASQARLAASLKANLPAWDGSTAAIDRLIDSGQKLGFTDDDTRDSMTLLVGATHDLTKATYIYNVAQDLARFKGISLHDASEALVKVQGGQYRLLKSLGIVLKDGATQTEALAAVQAVAGGQAEAYGKSQAGALDQMAIRADEANESIGHHLMPSINAFTDYSLTNTIPAIEGAADSFGHLIDVVQDLASGPVSKTNILDHILGSKDQVTGAGKEAMQSYMDGLLDRAAQIPPAVHDHVTRPTLAEMAKFREQAAAEAKRAGIQITDDLAGTLDGNKDVVKTAMDKVKFAITHPMQEAHELARIEGALTSQALADGIHSTNPAVRTVAIQQRQILIDEWQSITGTAYGQGRNAAQSYASGLGSVSFHVRDPFKDPGRDPGHKGPGGKAGGGDLGPGELSWVGENGPELIRTGGGAHVYSNAQSRGMMGGGVNVHVSLSTRDFSNQSRHFAVLQQSRSNF